jgi:hypothetical protein
MLMESWLKPAMAILDVAKGLNAQCCYLGLTSVLLVLRRDVSMYALFMLTSTKG